MTYFLGTNFGHDSAAALIDASGRLISAVEEGKLVAEKNCSLFPDQALSALTDSFDDERAAWGEGWNWRRRLWHKGFGAALRFGLREPRLWDVRLQREIRRYRDGLIAKRRWRGKLGSPTSVGHHRSHALSLLPWGLPPSSLVIVSDTTGEWESVSTWHWNGHDLTRLTRSSWPMSPGATLHQAAYHLGFSGERGPGKLMALSSWGDANAANLPSAVFNVVDGSFDIDLHQFPAYRYTDAWTAAAKIWRDEGHDTIADLVTRSYLAEQDGANFAAVVQDWFERTLAEIVNSALELAARMSLPVTAVGLTGGAALNCQANGRLLRALSGTSIGKIVVSPWSGDAGTAIGAAVAMAMEAGVYDFSCSSPLLGPTKLTDEVAPADLSQATDALLSGQLIGLVSGGVEFGPRALGGRCLLADARDPGSRVLLNTVKGRPQFMPLAPVVLEADSGTWFRGPVSTNMSWTVPYTAEAARQFPGMVHPSHETRAQAVVKEPAPLLHALLSRTRDAGMPVLLLTSLNGAGDPMLSDVNASVGAARSLGAGGCLTDRGWVDFAKQ